MQTIIHIGQHKTGTTSIQKFLQDNRGTLAESGVYVPQGLAGYNDPSHFILNVYALAEDRYSTKKRTLVESKGKHYLKTLAIELKQDLEKIYQDAVRKKCTQVIWSNEGLYLLNTIAEYKRLYDLFSTHSSEVEVVCCFRDVTSYRESYLKELTKKNAPLPLDTEACHYLEPDSWLFDYPRKKELLSEVFDTCTYFSYDQHDNIKKFMQAIHVNTGSTSDYKLNVTVKTRNKLLQRLKKIFAGSTSQA